MGRFNTICEEALALPPDVQEILKKELDYTGEVKSTPAGAILMGMHILEYLEFAKKIDDLLEEEHTSLKDLRTSYDDGNPLTPSAGIVLSLVIADMIAAPREITRIYKFEELAQKWHTGALLGIEPKLLNDDRILRYLSKLGLNPFAMKELLFKLSIDASEKLGVPLNRFITDTSLLELDGEFNKTAKVCPGRGTNSFSQLVVGLVIAAGVKLPVGFDVLPGNTSDSNTLPEVFDTINKVADEGAVELLMDRIYINAHNAIYLKEHENERMVYWISPLKTGHSKEKVRKEIDNAFEKGLWEPISYRSTKEVQKNIEPPLQAFETTWTLTEKIKPELKPGQKRRPRGSIITKEIETRCVFYKHELRAQKEKEKREIKKGQLEDELKDYHSKLNKRKYRELDHCETKLNQLLKSYGTVGNFVQAELKQDEALGKISLSWTWDEEALLKEERYDGIFALQSNYSKEQCNSDEAITKYRSRDQIEVNFKDLKGLLELENLAIRKDERIDAYIFLKIIGYFVLAFLRVFAEKEGIKTTEKKVQESLGDMVIVEGEIEPLGLSVFSVGNDNELNQLFRKIFNLPDPVELIKRLNDEEKKKTRQYIIDWYKNKVETIDTHSLE